MYDGTLTRSEWMVMRVCGTGREESQQANSRGTNGACAREEDGRGCTCMIDTGLRLKAYGRCGATRKVCDISISLANVLEYVPTFRHT